MKFKTIFLRNQLTTYLDDKNQEKKNLQSLLPSGWNNANFDYESSKDKGYGYVLKTGTENGITVIDCDTMESYEQLCLLYPDIHMHYTVKTRRGFHVYFKYDKTIKSINIDKVDLQNDNKLIIGQTTSVIRYNKEKYSYTFMGGLLMEMPKKIKDICVLQKDPESDIKKYTSKIKYDYEISDDEIRDIIEQIKEKHPEYLTDYNLWLKYTTVMKTIDKFDIWDEVNKQYSGYSRQNNLTIWKNIKMSISSNFFCRLLKMPLINFSKKFE